MDNHTHPFFRSMGGAVARRGAKALLVLLGIAGAFGLPTAEVARAYAESRGIPRRIVSLAPNLTEIIADLGLTERLVGVTRFCDYPPEVSKLPRLGGLMDPDIERIVGLKPDLVVMLKSETQRTEKRLRRAGLAVASYKIENVADILATYADLGRRLGVESVARERANAIHSAFTPPSSSKNAREQSRRKRIVFFISRPGGSFKSLLAAGNGTYFEDLARAASLGELALGTKGYVTVSIEAVLKARPDIIAEVVADDDSYDAQKRIADWDPFWKSQEFAPKIIVLKGNKFLRPGPRLVQALSELKSQVGSSAPSREAL
jgi:iron complex transport system substrate-binding protein